MCLSVLGATVGNYGQAEEGRSEGALGKGDRLLEVLRGVVELTEIVLGESEIMVRRKEVGRELDRLLEMRQACVVLMFEQEGRALFIGTPHRFRGHNELLNVHNRRSRRGRYILGGSGSRKQAATEEKNNPGEGK